MRKLNRQSVEAPARLVSQRQKERNDDSLRRLHQRFGGSIPREKYNSDKWRHDSVRDRVAELSSSQCAYCEQIIHGTNYKGQVEHFRPVAKYWWLAYTWENLLYACQICNGRKLDHFPIDGSKATDWGDLSQERPRLINPADESPRDILDYEFSDTGEPGKIIAKNEQCQKRVKDCEKYLRINRPVLKSKRRFFLGFLKLAVSAHQDGKPSGTERLRNAIDPRISEFVGMVLAYLETENIDPSTL